MQRPPTPILPRDLGGGLVLRRATAADAEALAAFNAGIHADPYDAVTANWIRDLLRGDHPAGTHEDVLLVEETATGAIASSLCLISQTWTYGSVPFPVGRPELVGTAPAYRRRGLVRAQMETLHAWGEARGQLMQVITGIPNYYRQFGYEPALAVERFSGAAANLPALPAGQAEPYRLRPATPDDLPVIARLGEQADRRSLLACPRDETLWRYEIFVRNPDSDYGQFAKIVETPAGEPVGLVCHGTWIDGRRLETILFEIVPERPWTEVTPSVLRGLRAAGQEMAAGEGTLERLGFTCGPDHPLVRLHPGWLERARRPFYVYVRIGDLAAFLRRVAPVLEGRLAASPLAGYTGELALSFYRDGLRLRFAGGRLTDVSRWLPTTEETGHAAFPDLTFLQLLLGARTLEQIEDAFPDCWANSSRVRALLATLFPAEASAPWPIG
jgi:hypothetical protein